MSNHKRERNEMGIMKEIYGEWLKDLEEMNENSLEWSLKKVFGEESVFMVDENTDFTTLPKMKGEENETK